MVKKTPFYMSILVFGVILWSLASVFSRDRGFRDRVDDFFRDHAKTADSRVIVDGPSSSILDRYYHHDDHMADGTGSLDYGPGDWSRHVLSPGYSHPRDGEGVVLYSDRDDEVNILSYGSLKFNLSYGDSVFTDNRYRLSPEDRPVSQVIGKGFLPEQELLLHMEGTIGKRVTVYIDHDSRKNDNYYLMQYRALRDDEVIQEINAGMIDIKFNHSRYAVYDNATSKGMGVDVTLKKKNFQVKAFASIMRGEAEVEYFKGTSSPGSHRLMEYQYLAGRYYQLEPFSRYDGIIDRSALPGDETAFYNLITFTSAPSTPGQYLSVAVNIHPAGFELFMDDQNPYNNYNALQLSLDGGSYTRLQAGTDYSINFATGLITFLRDLPEQARVFAVYATRGGTLTSDPSARTDVAEFPGRLFVFIKYGPAMSESVSAYGAYPLQPIVDLNGDGVCNLDIYEVRSFYYLGDSGLLVDNFRLTFYDENRVMSSRDVGGQAEIDSIGPYSVDYARGIVSFNLREPFRYLLAQSGASRAARIYAEKQQSNLFELSRYRITIDYYRDARTFQLKHFNIIPDSVRVKVNGAELPSSLYSVDNTAGYLVFTDPNNPLINAETDIEIRYEFLPLDGQTQSFIGGIRADYAVTKNFNLGGSVLYSKSSTGDTVPQIDDTPTQTLMLEGDALLSLDEKAFKKIGRFLTKKDPGRIPLEFKAYGEYARSFRDINTFGKAMIENMESSSDLLTLSMSERDWVLSSMPSGTTQADRAALNYYYYRDLSDPERLRGLSFTPRSVAYEVKPGPFNVATGHVDSSILSSSSQISLAMDFDFTSGEYASIVTRRLGDSSVDLSGLQYVEICYRYEGEAPGDLLDFNLDIGRVNEDADGDGILDTEDVNNNGYIDVDPVSGYSEDRGYAFNGNRETRVGAGPGFNALTRGNGVLDTEDLNRNGVLDTSENVFTLPGAATRPTSLTFSAADNDWKMERVYIDQSSLSLANQELLKNARSVRLWVRRNPANAGTGGRLYIDTIKFISSRWKRLLLSSNPLDPGGGDPADANTLSVTVVNSISDPDYRSGAFHFEKRGVYQSLYGERDRDELKKESESALKVDYSIPAGSSHVSLTRTFARPMDLRFYKTLNLWINYRTAPAGEIGVIIGSSESDYNLYRFQVDQSQIWKQVRLKLKKSSSGSVSLSASEGDIDMKRISYIRVVVFAPGESGSFWLNDVYASEAEQLEDDAYWVESELRVTEPLYRTKKGTPVFSDLHLKYVRKAHGSQFSSIAKTVSDMSEEYDEVSTSFAVLPGWTTSVNYIRERTETDSLNEDVAELNRGNTLKNSVYWFMGYDSDKNAVPSLRLTYKYDDYDNTLMDSVSDYRIRRNMVKDNHAPSLSITEIVERFLWGKITIRYILDMVYKNETIERSSDDLDDPALASFVSLREDEKRQKTDTHISLDYQCKAFYLRPQISFGSQEIVAFRGRGAVNDTEIREDFAGDYHFPYDYTGDLKFVERSKKGSLTLGTNYWKYVSPSYIFNIQYLENRFGDSAPGEGTSRFDRERDARSLISTQLVIPINFYSSEKMRFIKNVNISYGRSVYCSESNVPYEGESTDFQDEHFGPGRSINRLLGAGMNIFEYYPFYSFVGRDNFAQGRDYVYGTLNKSISLPGGGAVADYNNQLRLVENFALNWTLDFGRVVIDSGGGLDQICERQNIYGIPQQTVSWNLSFNINFNLMELLNFGFFRTNREGLPHHASNLDLGYSYENNMIVTSNIDEHVHTPRVALTFKWDRASVGASFSVDFRKRFNKDFIPADASKRSRRDDRYFDNMAAYASFHQQDEGYNLTVAYETDVKWIYNIFAKFYQLTSSPIYQLEYVMKLNRHDYRKAVSPEPYDLHLITSTLTLDLHRYVQGGFYSRFALEQYRRRGGDAVTREIFSYELGLNFSLVF
jgi:hypothetical protein